MESLKLLFLFLSLLLPALVQAQTPSDAPLPTENHLGITFANSFEISPPGLLVDRNCEVPVCKTARWRAQLLFYADTIRTPHLSISSKLVSTNDSYIVLAVDLNVLRNATVHTTLLHWFAMGLVVPPCADSGRQKNPAHAGSVPVQPGPTTLDTPGAFYLGPNPPPGTGTHHHVFWVFKQPPNFIVPIEYCLINPPNIPSPNSGRLGFDITDFVQAAGLGYPIAANFFQITAVPALVPQNPPNTYCNGQSAAC